MRINLYGGPNTGKSTLASYIFSQLKLEHRNIELVSEYIKDWAYEKRVPDGWDQIYLFAKQHRKEKRMVSAAVENIITDSPMLLQIAYGRKYKCHGIAELFSIACKWEKFAPGIHLFIDRKGIPYQQQGRYENLSQAKAMDRRIKTVLDDAGMPYQMVPNDPVELTQIVRDLISR